jgi:hypothetical protein
MDAVKDVDTNFSEEISPSMITIKNYGRAVLVTWRIVGYLDDFVAIDPKLLEQPGGEVRLMLSLRKPPTSASPQG